MASASAIHLSASFLLGRRTRSSAFPKLPASRVAGKQTSLAIFAKAVGSGSESSSGSIVKYVQNAWSNAEDRIALAGLGFAAIVAVWASSNLITAIDKLPLLPSVLEIIGVLFSWWFVYRYLLFKPDRQELLRNVKNSLSDILGQ